MLLILQAREKNKVETKKQTTGYDALSLYDDFSTTGILSLTIVKSQGTMVNTNYRCMLLVEKIVTERAHSGSRAKHHVSFSDAGWVAKFCENQMVYT